MVYWKISDDLKEVALHLAACSCDSIYDIVAITGFSRWTFYNAHQQKRNTGSIAKEEAIGHSWPRTLLQHDSDYLLCLVHHKPTLFLNEYSWHLKQSCELSVSLATIHQTLKQAGLNVKHIQKLAAERDPFLCANFIRRIGQYPANYLLSIDEVSKDDQTYTQLWGQTPVGKQVEQHDPFVQWWRYSMVAALVLDKGIVASRVLEGLFKHDTFFEYLHDDVVCHPCISVIKMLMFYLSFHSRLHSLGLIVFFSLTMQESTILKRSWPSFTVMGASLNTFLHILLISNSWTCLFSHKVSSLMLQALILHIQITLLWIIQGMWRDHARNDMGLFSTHQLHLIDTVYCIAVI